MAWAYVQTSHDRDRLRQQSDAFLLTFFLLLLAGLLSVH